MAELKSSVANANVLPVVNSIFDFSAEALGELKTWLEGNPPSIPVTQIIGFAQFAAKSATVSASESTTSGSFVDLTTVGPTISGLSAGNYLLLYAAILNTSAGSAARVSYSINGAAAVGSANMIYSEATAATTGAMVSIVSLSANSNSVTLKYASTPGGSASSFQNRWLIALRYSNL